MKISRYLFAIMGMGLALSSCSSDDSLFDGPELPDEAPAITVKPGEQYTILASMGGSDSRTMIDYDTPAGQGVGMFWMPGDQLGVMTTGTYTRTVKVEKRTATQKNWVSYQLSDWSTESETTTTGTELSVSNFSNNLFMQQRQAPFTGTVTEPTLDGDGTTFSPSGTNNSSTAWKIYSESSDHTQTRTTVTTTWTSNPAVSGAFYPATQQNGTPGDGYGGLSTNSGDKYPLFYLGREQSWTNATSIAYRDIKATKNVSNYVNNTFQAQFTSLASMVKIAVKNFANCQNSTVNERLVKIVFNSQKTDLSLFQDFCGLFKLDFSGETPQLVKNGGATSTSTDYLSFSWPNNPLLSSDPWGYFILPAGTMDLSQVTIEIDSHTMGQNPSDTQHISRTIQPTSSITLVAGMSYVLELDLGAQTMTFNSGSVNPEQGNPQGGID